MLERYTTLYTQGGMLERYTTLYTHPGRHAREVYLLYTPREAC